MKKTIVRLLALIMALTLVASLCACSGGDNKDVTTTAEQLTDTTDDTVASTDAAPAVTDETATAPADETTTAVETTTAAAVLPLPTSTAEILNYYNTATAKAANTKVAFSKTRSTTEGSYDAGVVLKTFKSLVYQFIGIGADNVYTKDVAKNDENYSRYLKASTLTEGDIKEASVKQSGTDYIITIKVKDGGSTITDGKNFKNNSPLDKSGIGVGLNDKDYYDHKTAENVYDAIDEVGSEATIIEKYSGAVITATVDSATGNLKSMNVKFDISFDISKVLGSGGTATGTTTVEYKSFKW